MTEIKFKCNLGVKGEYLLIKGSKARNTREVIGPFKNVITDIGMDKLGAGGIGGDSRAYVGTGTGTPAVTDTNMFAYLASSNPAAGAENQYAGAPTYRARASIVYSFNEGVAAGNLSEVGIGWNASPANAIFSHALILDGGGNPTTITVLPDEYLDVVYLFDLYPPLTDLVQSGVSVSPGTHDVVTRAAFVGSWNVGRLLTGGMSAYENISYSGDLGGITGAPSGAASATTQVSLAPYGLGDYFVDMTARYGLTLGNFTPGIKSVRSTVCYGGTSGIGFQTSFTPVIPKTNRDILTLRFRVAWSRYTP